MTRPSESTECELLQPVTGQPMATNEHGATISLQQQLPPAVESAELIPTFETSLPDNTTKCTCGHSSKRGSSCSDQPGLYKSRCPCLRANRKCTELCTCNGCTNPHGTKPLQNKGSQPFTRKRIAHSTFQHITKKVKAVTFLTNKA